MPRHKAQQIAKSSRFFRFDPAIDSSKRQKKGVKVEILREIQDRRQYKTKWQAIARAKAKGLNTDLLDRFYMVAKKRGYTKEFTKELIFYSARAGVFGFVNALER